MAIQPRQIAGMVEGSMGAGGQAMPEEQSLQIELPSTEEQLPDGIDHNSVYFAITSGINSDQVKLAQTLNDTISLSPISVNSKGGILSIESRVSDKTSGDIGHPVQFDTSIGQWYVNTSTTNNEIYDSVVGLGTSTLV